MASVLAKEGKPFPYRLQCRGNPLVQHAIIECCVCHEEDAFPYRDHPQNPTLICQRFTRRGWDIYKNAKARCPECKAKRQQTKAHFARSADMQSTPVNKPQISLVKTQKPEQPTALASRQAYLVVIQGGVPTIQSLAGASEMIFGDKSYLVIPLDEENTPDEC